MIGSRPFGAVLLGGQEELLQGRWVCRQAVASDLELCGREDASCWWAQWGLLVLSIRAVTFFPAFPSLRSVSGHSSFFLFNLKDVEPEVVPAD